MKQIKMTLCLATNNQNKVEELRAMLSFKYEFKTLKEIGCLTELPETHNTFRGNSLQKAEYVYNNYGLNCIADDSGLEVDALNGEPGVYSAHYAGEHGNHEANIRKLLQNLEGVENRKARFRSVISVIISGEVFQFEGIINGRIINEKRGNRGFGYDPVFIPEGYDRTFAEMSMEEKNPISHRGVAVKKLVEFLKERNL